MTRSGDYFYQRTGRTFDQIIARKKHFAYCNYFATVFCLATFIGLFAFIIIAVVLYYGGDSTNRILHSLIFIIPCTLSSIWKVYAKLNLKRVTDEEEFAKILQSQSHAYHNEIYGRNLGVPNCNTNFTNGSIHFNQAVHHRRDNDQVVSNDGLLNNLEHSTSFVHGDEAFKNVPELNALDPVSENHSENNSVKDDTEAVENIYEELKEQRVTLANLDDASVHSFNLLTVVKLDDSLGVQEANTDISQMVHNDNEEESCNELVSDKCSRSNDESAEYVKQEPKQDTTKDNVDLSSSSSSRIFKGVTFNDNLSVKDIDTETSLVVNTNNNRELDNCSTISNLDSAKLVSQEPQAPTNKSDVAGLYSSQRFRRGKDYDSVDLERTDTENISIVTNNSKEESNQETSSENTSIMSNIDFTESFIQKTEQDVPEATADASTLRSSKRFKRVRFADNPVVHEMHREGSEEVINIDEVEPHHENRSANIFRINDMDITESQNRESKLDDSPINADVAGVCSPQRFRRVRFDDNLVQEEDAESLRVALSNDNKESNYETGSQNNSRRNKMYVNNNNMNQDSNQYGPTDISGLGSPRRFKRVRFADSLVVQEPDSEILDVVNDNNEKESAYEIRYENSFIMNNIDLTKTMDQGATQNVPIVNKFDGLFIPQWFRTDEIHNSVGQETEEMFRVNHHNINEESHHEKIIDIFSRFSENQSIEKCFKEVEQEVLAHTVAENFRVNHQNNKREFYHERMLENSSRFSNKQSTENVHKQVEQELPANNVAVNKPLQGCRRKVKYPTTIQEADIHFSQKNLNKWESDSETRFKGSSRQNRVETKYVNQESKHGFLVDDLHIDNLGSKKPFRRSKLDDSVGAQEREAQFSEVFSNDYVGECSHEREMRSKKSSRRKHRYMTKDWDQEANENSEHFRRGMFNDCVGVQEKDTHFFDELVNNHMGESGHEMRSKKSSRRKHRDKTIDWDQEQNENSSHSSTSRRSERIRKFRVHDIFSGSCEYYNEKIVCHEGREDNEESDNHEIDFNYPSVRYRDGMKEYVFGPLSNTGSSNNGEELADEIWVTTHNQAMDFGNPNASNSNRAPEYIFEPTPLAAAGINSTRIDIDTKETAQHDRSCRSSRCKSKNSAGNSSSDRPCCSDVYYDYDNFFSPSLN